MSDTPLIYGRMAAVLSDLNAVGKGSRNKDQGFDYRGIEDIVNALHGCLADHEVFYLPKVLERLPEVRQTRGGNPMWAVHLHVSFTFYTVDGSSVEASTWGEGTDLADKATSKAHTFAQKSCLLQAFNIATADMEDPDATGIESGPPSEDARDWFQQNGWADKAEHDAYRLSITDLLKRAQPAEQAAFKAWRETEGIPGFTSAHTKEQAGLVSSHILEFVKDPPTAATPKNEKPAAKRTPTNDQQLTKKGRECGLNAQERADAIYAITAGRTRLGKDLSFDEQLAVEEAYVALADHSKEFDYDEHGNPSLVDVQKLPVA